MQSPLSYLRLAVRGVRHYWRSQLSVLLGTAVAAAALVGALLVGDCVTFSLRSFALMRLGKTHEAVQTSGRYVDATLASRLAAASGVDVAPLLVMQGMVRLESADGRQHQVNQAQIVGIDPRFWDLSPGPAYNLEEGQAALNIKLASELGLTPGDEVSIRIGVPGLMPSDAPLSARGEGRTRRGTFAVAHTIPDEHLGRFSLSANQVAPFTAFVDIRWLQEAADLSGRANVLLAGAPEATPSEGMPLSDSLARVWQLGDVGVSFRRVGEIALLESDRVFLDPALVRAATADILDGETKPVTTLSYLVNAIRKGEHATPYSFVVAASPSPDRTLGPVPMEMRDDQVIINQWLADAIGAAPGDALTVAYSRLEAGGGFTEHERGFSVLRIETMDALSSEAALMPAFPGLTDVEQCDAWDVGMPMDRNALKDEANQAYWETYHTTPKLACTLQAGREMWGSRFGDTTAIRYRMEPDQEAALAESIRSTIDPGALGLRVQPVRENALKAVDQAMSFGELFVSMSSFLIAAALMLTGMLFVFSIQHRAGEMGLLLAVGYPASRVRRLFLWEGGIIALLGSLVGGVAGMGYTRALIWGLATYWEGAVANAAIQYHVTPTSVIEGVVASLVCALAAMALAMRKLTRRAARDLLVEDPGQDRPVHANRAARIRTGAVLGASVVSAVGTVLYGLRAPQDETVYLFFGAGALLLVGGLAFSRLLLQLLDHGAIARLSVSGLGMRQASRRAGRSLTTVALLACGCFLVVAISAMQQDLAAIAHERWSGTGGFSLYAESTLPLPDPLETTAGRERFGLEREPLLAGVSFLSMKVRAGDDASCFNLNRAQTPRLIGVAAAAMTERAAFMPQGSSEGAPWSLFDLDLPEGVIPGLAGDANTAMWNLEKTVGPEAGDEIDYTDEYGNPFRVRLVGSLPMPLSIFQGSILIPRDAFERCYPSEAGFRACLIDLPAGVEMASVEQVLTRRLERVGLDVQPALTRLLAFHGVEATYLHMFLVLGGLGVLLGTIGLGVVVMRNMLERRSELALLQCLGFSRARIIWLALSEHWLLLLLGLTSGSIAAAIAIYPTATAPGMHLPLRAILQLLAAILIVGLAATILAALAALRGKLLPALRQGSN